MTSAPPTQFHPSLITTYKGTRLSKCTGLSSFVDKLC